MTLSLFVSLFCVNVLNYLRLVAHYPLQSVAAVITAMFLITQVRSLSTSNRVYLVGLLICVSIPVALVIAGLVK